MLSLEGGGDGELAGEQFVFGEVELVLAESFRL